MIGIVLIGGKSKRMGKPKACIEVDGEKMAIRTAKLLSRYSDKVFLSGRKDQVALVGKSPFPFIIDNYTDIGPIAGILSAFENIRQNPIMITATDMPFLDDETVQTLLEKRDINKLATMYYHQESGFLEPLCAIYEPAAYQVLKEARKRGEYAFYRIFKKDQLKLIPVVEMKPLTNINFPDQMDGIKQ